MRALRMSLVLLFLSATGLTVAACDDDGPAEQAGEKVDEAVQDTKRAVDDATD